MFAFRDNRSVLRYSFSPVKNVPKNSLTCEDEFYPGLAYEFELNDMNQKKTLSHTQTSQESYLLSPEGKARGFEGGRRTPQNIDL